MKLLSKLSLIAALLTLSHVAMAADDDIPKGGLFIEPMITYETGTVDVSYPAPFRDSNEDVKGFGLGARIGGHIYDSVFLAVDGRYSMPKYDSSALGGNNDASAWNYGATLGVQTPLYGIRIWGTYILGGTLDPKEINNVDVKFNDLKGYRIGAGIYVYSVSINLEYQDAKYDSTTVEKAGPITGTTDSIKGTDKSYIVSVSFPIAL